MVQSAKQKGGAHVKRSRLSYDEWKCITAKKLSGRQVQSDFFTGYVGLMEIQQVSEAQKWKFYDNEFVVCDAGLKWLSILPKDDFYCITAMMNQDDEILVWYIDMIAAQGIDADGIPYFDDLYLDLVVCPNGEIMVDDMDELEDALCQADITQAQFDLAVHTADTLKNGLLKDIRLFQDYTIRCCEMITDKI